MPNPLTKRADGDLSVDVEQVTSDTTVEAKANGVENKAGWVCPSPSLHEDVVEAAFVKAVNKLLQGREAAIAAFELAQATVFDTSVLEIDLVSVNAELKSINARMRAAGMSITSPDAYEMASTPVNDGATEADGITYMDVSTTAANEAKMALRMRMEEAKQKQDRLRKTIKNKRKRRIGVDDYIKTLKENMGSITEFSPELFNSLVDFVTVNQIDKNTTGLTFTFLDGTEIMVKA